MARLLERRLPALATLESLQTGRALREMRAQLARLPKWLEYFAVCVSRRSCMYAAHRDAGYVDVTTYSCLSHGSPSGRRPNAPGRLPAVPRPVPELRQARAPGRVRPDYAVEPPAPDRPRKGGAGAGRGQLGGVEAARAGPGGDVGAGANCAGGERGEERPLAREIPDVWRAQMPFSMTVLRYSHHPYPSSKYPRIESRPASPPASSTSSPDSAPLRGRPWASHPLVRKVDVTGGTATGREIAAAAGRNLASVVAELGGKGRQ